MGTYTLTQDEPFRNLPVQLEHAGDADLLPSHSGPAEPDRPVDVLRPVLPEVQQVLPPGAGHGGPGHPVVVPLQLDPGPPAVLPGVQPGVVGQLVEVEEDDDVAPDQQVAHLFGVQALEGVGHLLLLLVEQLTRAGTVSPQMGRVRMWLGVAKEKKNRDKRFFQCCWYYTFYN